MTNFEYTWRWYGSYDTIPLSDIRQTGAEGIVTALHHIPPGEVWPTEEIQKRKKQIEEADLRWSVVESVPVHEDIKKQSGSFKTQIENYKQSIINLAECGIDTVCYNFMPVTDWTRTDVNHALDDSSTTLRFDTSAFAAFDLFILERERADQSYSEEEHKRAKTFFDACSARQKDKLTHTILLGLPGDEEMTVEKFRQLLEEYSGIDEAALRSNLHHFLQAIIPIAEEHGVKMAIHPDDPPFPLFGLPRIVSTQSDVRELLDAADSPSNGLTFCTGSYGARPDNDLPAMISKFGSHIHFIHLRSVKRDSDGSFQEARHLEGDAGMADVMRALIEEQHRRKKEGRNDLAIPLRPDHGQRILDDLNRESYPGYSGLGRLRGLAELRGLEMGLRSSTSSRT